MGAFITDHWAKNLYFHIEISNILTFFSDLVTEFPDERKNVPSVIELLKQVILQLEQEPFMTFQQYKDGDIADDYYENYQRNDKQLDEYALRNIFSVEGDFYDIDVPVIVRGDMVKYTDFAKLFYLKLYSYKNDEHILDTFLRFHLLDNFYGNYQNYIRFLETVIDETIPLEYSKMIKAYLTSWIEKMFLVKIPLKPVNSSYLQKIIDDINVIDEDKNERSSVIESDEEVSINSFDTQPGIDVVKVHLENKIEEIKLTENRNERTIIQTVNEVNPIGIKMASGELDKNGNMPENYEQISTSISKKELLQYFSFLHKEKSEGGLPFLPEEAVKDIFKFGLSIPASPPEKKYKLNVSLRFPKKIFDCAIHRFYKFRINKDKISDKNSIIRFFASYLTDYENALIDNQSLESTASNIRGEHSSRIKFIIKDYIPDYEEPAKHIILPTLPSE